MSPKRRKNVSQLVEKYRRQFPTLERSLLRKLIRLENPELFKNNLSMASNLRALDRHLRKAFENGEPGKEKPLKDFPLEVNAMLSLLDVMVETEKPEMAWMFKIWRQNILTLYPKMDLDIIADLTMEEVKATCEKDPFMQRLIAKFKERLS